MVAGPGFELATSLGTDTRKIWARLAQGEPGLAPYHERAWPWFLRYFSKTDAGSEFRRVAKRVEKDDVPLSGVASWPRRSVQNNMSNSLNRVINR